MEHSKLTGPHRSRSGPCLLSLVFCILPAKNACSAGQRGPGFYAIKLYKHLSTNKREKTLMYLEQHFTQFI